MKSRLTVTLSFVVSLFLTLTLLATALCAFGSAFLVKSEGLEKAALTSDYSNTLYEEIKYDFESVKNLSIYQFNESVKQIIRKVDYDNRMFGVYSGTISAKDLSQEDLDWLTHK